MNLEQIKTAVSNGQRVFWKNTGYEVIKDKIGQWLIHCNLNGSCIGLTWRDEKTMNGEENDFFVKPITMREFFELPEIKRAQDVQKVNPFHSLAHRNAYAVILRMARKHKVSKHFGKY